MPWPVNLRVLVSSIVLIGAYPRRVGAGSWTMVSQDDEYGLHWMAPPDVVFDLREPARLGRRGRAGRGLPKTRFRHGERRTPRLRSGFSLTTWGRPISTRP